MSKPCSQLLLGRDSLMVVGFRCMMYFYGREGAAASVSDVQKTNGTVSEKGVFIHLRLKEKHVIPPLLFYTAVKLTLRGESYLL